MRQVTLILVGAIVGSLITILVAPKLLEAARTVALGPSQDAPPSRPEPRETPLAGAQPPSSPGLGALPSAPPQPKATVPPTPEATRATDSGSISREEEDARADSQREVPLTQHGALLRAGRLVQESGAFGDAAKFEARLSLVGSSGQLMTREGRLPPPGRLTPWDLAGFAMRVQGREPSAAELEARGAEAWALFQDENRLLAQIAARTQALIDVRVAEHASMPGVVAVELRGGAAYVVKKGDDSDLDRMLFDLDALRARREAFTSPGGR